MESTSHVSGITIYKSGVDLSAYTLPFYLHACGENAKFMDANSYALIVRGNDVKEFLSAINNNFQIHETASDLAVKNFALVA